jgi:hypothetical protein
MYANLNLATKPLVSHRRFFVGAALSIFVAGVLCLVLGLRFYSARKDEEDFRMKSNKLQAEMTALMQQRQDLERFYQRDENRNLQERAKFLDGVAEADSFDWTKMFMDLEHTLPSGVHVVRVEPRLDRGTVSVKFLVGALNQEAELKMLKAFEESKSFSHFELQSEALPRQAGADALTVEFSVIYTGI